MDLPPVRVPDDWGPVIDKRRGKRSVAEYIRDLVFEDMPRKARSLVSAPAVRGRPRKAPVTDSPP
jgi:hypothetical protein